MFSDGGPAFPRVAHPSLTYEDLGATGTDPQHGMSLRDYFAAAALSGVVIGAITEPDLHAEPRIVARMAYEIADAMIAARRQRPAPATT